MSSLTTYDPNKHKPSAERRRYDWEGDSTRVDERTRFRNRVRWFFADNWGRMLLLAVILAALFSADFMTGLLGFIEVALPILARFALSAVFVIGQFALFFWFMGRTRAYTIWPGSEVEGISFADYRGQPELLEQARQIVTLLRGVRAFEEAGGEPLNGLLLEGPPGTGKTWLAKAISTEAGVPFFYIDGSGFQSTFIGIAPLKVMNLYRKARKAAKEYGASIIFIDEIDAVGSRGGVAQKRASSREPMPEDRTKSFTRLPMMFGGMGQDMGLMSTLLVEMSGFSQEHGFWARKRAWWYKTFLRRKPPKPQKRVLTIGATNRIGALDPALLRPGRFDKKIRVDAPDLEGRREIVEYYLTKIAHDESVDPLIIAIDTQYYTPADIKYLLNEALRYALFDGRTYMTYRDFQIAQPEHEEGVRTPIKNMTKEAKFRLAAHEAAHAIAIRLYQPNYRISRITIIQQGLAFGHVSAKPAIESYDYIATLDDQMNQLKIAVAGKAGEMEFCGVEEQTLGVGGDFATVRYVLGRMATTGMFGPFGWSADIEVRKEVREMMEETFLTALDETRIAMRVNGEMGKALIELLMEKEELLAGEVEAFFDQYGFYTPKPEILLKRQNESVA